MCLVRAARTDGNDGLEVASCGNFWLGSGKHGEIGLTVAGKACGSGSVG